MNRRGFLKRIGIFSAGAIIAPQLIIEQSTKTVSVPVETTTGLFHQIKRGNIVKYGSLTKDQLQEAVEAVFNKEPQQERQFKLYGGREFYKQFNSFKYAS